MDIALGSAAPSLGAIKALADPRISLHLDAVDMARLTAEADLAVGAGGSSTWERACLGLPAATIILADNQRDLALRMEADGLTVAVDAASPGWQARLKRAFAALAADGSRRRAISTRLAAHCDGLGSERVAAAILG
jgi:spore coat polysaccharide biosynthesis predicted glycosyltransferase SpsG